LILIKYIHVQIKQEKVGNFIKNAECPKPIENLQGFIQSYGGDSHN